MGLGPERKDTKTFGTLTHRTDQHTMSLEPKSLIVNANPLYDNSQEEYMGGLQLSVGATRDKTSIFLQHFSYPVVV